MMAMTFVARRWDDLSVLQKQRITCHYGLKGLLHAWMVTTASFGMPSNANQLYRPQCAPNRIVARGEEPKHQGSPAHQKTSSTSLYGFSFKPTEICGEVGLAPEVELAFDRKVASSIPGSS